MERINLNLPIENDMQEIRWVSFADQFHFWGKTLKERNAQKVGNDLRRDTVEEWQTACFLDLFPPHAIDSRTLGAAIVRAGVWHD